MPGRWMRFAVVLGLLAAVVLPAHAQTAPRRVLYKLDKGALFQRGCFDPCMCPVMMRANVRGTFLLTHTGFDGLFDTYAVTDVHWIVDQEGSRLFIKGAGTYKVGGEFAVQQQLALDLAVGGDPVTHYDSGLVTGPSAFPRIDLPVSINGGYCFDTVIDVRSRPAIDLDVSDSWLSWNVVPQATGYDIVSGDLRALRESGGDFTVATTGCLAANTDAGSVFSAAQPAPGEGTWFLARWLEGTERETWDADDPAQMGSSDAAIEASAGACR